MTPQDLWAATGCRPDVAERCAPHLRAAINKWNVRRVASFLAQTAHESRLFTRTIEDLNYTTPQRIREVWPSRFPKVEDAIPYVRDPRALAIRVYSNRRDLGNPPGDSGWVYRGRAWIMVTGLGNYTRYQQATGIEVINHPDLLEDPRYAADAAGWFWSTRLLDSYDDARRVSRIVSGGETGLEERLALTRRALEVFP